jgi:hypothetical protein
MNGPIAYLVACASCGAHPTASFWVTDVPQPSPWHCPKCRRGLIPAEEHAVVGAVVQLIGQVREARWLVVDRDDNSVTLRPLGLPDWPTTVFALGEVSPMFSYERLSAAKNT